MFLKKKVGGIGNYKVYTLDLEITLLGIHLKEFKDRKKGSRWTKIFAAAFCMVAKTVN